MSWFIAPVETDHNTVASDLRNAKVQGQDADLWHVGHAVEEARLAAIELVRRGGVGNGRVRVTMSGHANPHHEPAEGWTNDCITISVAQV